jgi:hypothetical protein
MLLQSNPTKLNPGAKHKKNSHKRKEKMEEGYMR